MSHNNNFKKLFWTNLIILFALSFRTDGAYYSAEPDVGEFGVYDLILMHSGANKFQTAKEPVNTTTCMID